MYINPQDMHNTNIPLWIGEEIMHLENQYWLIIYSPNKHHACRLKCLLLVCNVSKYTRKIFWHTLLQCTQFGVGLLDELFRTHNFWLVVAQGSLLNPAVVHTGIWFEETQAVWMGPCSPGGSHVLLIWSICLDNHVNKIVQRVSVYETCLSKLATSKQA